MPAVAAFIATTGVEILGVSISTATILQAAVVVSSALYNRSRAREAQRAARAGYNASLIDHQVVIRSAVAPRTITYGHDKVSGPLVFGHSSGTKKEFLHLVIALGGHEFADIEKIFFNEIELPALDGGGYVTSGQFCRTFTRSLTDSTSAGSLVLAHTPSKIVGVTKATGSGDLASVTLLTSPTGYTLSGATVTFVDGPLTGGDAYTVNYEWEQAEPRVRIKKYMGNPGQVADAALISESGGKWTTDHVGVGIPYLYVRLEFDRQVFGQIGVPNISAYAKGKKVLDTRTSVVAWSDNAALCAADYKRDAVLGMGCTAAQVPAAEVNTAANISDEDVAIVNFAAAALATHWDTNGDLESWAASGATAAVSGGKLRLTSTGTDPQLSRGSLTISGAANTTVRARIKRVAGAGWQGSVYYTTSGHGHSESFKKTIAAPTFDANGWAVVEWDMTALTAGGADWISNTITGVRVDLGNTGSDQFDIDWLAVGSEDTQKRYTFNGTLSTGTGRLDNLRTLLLPLAGSSVWVQGRWLLRAGAHRSSEFTLDESWIAGPRKIMPRSPRTELFNAVTGRFVDAAQNFAEVQYPIVTNAGYETADGGKRIVKTIAMPGVAETMRAQRLAKIAIERARQARTITLVCNMRGYNTLPTQVGTVNLARYGYVGDQFEVLRRELNVQARTVTLTLRETAASVWNWVYGEATIGDLAPNTSLPSWSDPPPELTGLNVDSGTSHLMKLADGSIVTRGYVTWNEVGSAFVQRGGRIEIAWKLDSDANWQTAPPLAGSETSAYVAPLDDRRVTIVRVRAVSDLGREGPWAYKVHTVVGKTAAPADVTSFVGVTIPGAIRFTWARNNEIDYLETELRQGPSWAAGGTIFAGAVDRWDWAWPISGTYTVWAKHRDTSHNESATAVSVSVSAEPALINTTSDLVLVRSSGMEVVGNAVTKVAGGSNWNEAVHSRDAHLGGAIVTFRPAQTDKALMIGLNTDPAADNSYTSLDYAIYLTDTATFDVYESGVGISLAIAYAATDVFAVAYDGADVVYMRNGVAFRTVAAPLGLKLHQDSSFFHVGGKALDLKFAALANVADIETRRLAIASATVTAVARATSSTASLAGGAPGDVTVTAVSLSYVNDTGATISVQVEASHFDAFLSNDAAMTTKEYFLDQTGAVEGNEAPRIELFGTLPDVGNFQGFARAWQYTLANGATLACALKVRVVGTATSCSVTVDAPILRVTAIKR